ncbi:unnamed protein product [Mucor hiemalis]
MVEEIIDTANVEQNIVETVDNSPTCKEESTITIQNVEGENIGVDGPIIDDNESGSANPENGMTRSETENGALDEIESNLYCSVCLLPQKEENFLKHIKEHKEEGSATGWGKYSLPVLLPLFYAAPREQGATHPTNRSIIKHPEILPDPDDPSFYCKGCERNYFDKSAYRIHIIRVHNISVVTGRENRESIIAFPGLFPDPDDPTRYCASCDRNFYTQSTFLTHIKSYHYTGIHSSYDCELCQVPYGKVEYLDRHMLNKHQIKRIKYVDKPYRNNCKDTKTVTLTCPFCVSTFVTIEDYLKHTDTHYNSKEELEKRPVYAIPNPDDNDLFCSACQYNEIQIPKLIPQRGGRKLSNPQEHSPKSSGVTSRQHSKRLLQPRIIHPKVMPDPKEKLFYCGACDMKYLSQTEFYIHLQNKHSYSIKELRYLSDDPVYSCPLCDAEIENRSAFSIHLKTAHSMNLAAPVTTGDFTCETCEEEFTRKTHLINHIADEHPHANPGRKCNMFYCCFCNQYCFTSIGLGLHKQKSHNISFILDEAKFYCNLCERALPSITRYHRHLRQHKIDIERVATTPDPSGATTSNPSDPNNTYCQSCHIQYNSNSQYRLHCFRYHRVKSD